jgi:hypothetical protein
VPTFVIETYLSRARATDLGRIVDELVRAIDRLADGPAVQIRPAARHVRSYYVAEDEIAYHLVEVGSTEAAAVLSAAANLVPTRIVEVETPAA